MCRSWCNSSSKMRNRKDNSHINRSSRGNSIVRNSLSCNPFVLVFLFLNLLEDQLLLNIFSPYILILFVQLNLFWSLIFYLRHYYFYSYKNKNKQKNFSFDLILILVFAILYYTNQIIIKFYNFFYCVEASHINNLIHQIVNKKTLCHNYKRIMCGICFVLNIPIQNHHFNFNFFSAYNPSSHHENLPLNKHIQHNKLTLNNHFVPSFVCNLIGKRGPDHVKVTEIDMYKTLYKEAKINIYIEEEFKVPKNTALAIQSTLHLRGNHIYHPNVPGSFFLYNGQIWDTGSLKPIQTDKGQNDAQWLHKALVNCKGNQEKILQTLRELRGDYAIIMVQADKIFIMKDYFGKRSLLVGMSQDHLVFTSSPIEKVNGQQQKQENGLNNDEQANEVSWKQKYEAEWLSSRSKQFFEVPNNSLIVLTLRNNEAVWQHFPIHEFSLRAIEKVPNQLQEQIMKNCKKLLVQSVKQLTKCIKDINFSNKKFEESKNEHKKHDLKGEEYRQSIKQVENKGAKVAVLFSGGIDSTMIARILDLVLPKDEQIDLINLAFRQDAPDRESGNISYNQLKTLSPQRKFNLILANKTLHDIQVIKQDLTTAIYPKTTHMDFNIASALHIASKQTQAKIIFTGLGADEIFSGYSRYRIAFKRAGYEEMENQMLFDMDRLWIRNLGRDDRAIAINAKQVRYPFLYLPLWKYLRTVELNKLTEGTGQKMLLRKIAKDLGLQKASTFKKKAIQFGTRLAKLSNVKCFGSNRKAKGTYQYK